MHCVRALAAGATPRLSINLDVQAWQVARRARYQPCYPHAHAPKVTLRIHTDAERKDIPKENIDGLPYEYRYECTRR